MAHLIFSYCLTYEIIAERLEAMRSQIKCNKEYQYLLNSCGHTRCTDERVCFVSGDIKFKYNYEEKIKELDSLE